jgi:Fe-S-cluster containining protein
MTDLDCLSCGACCRAFGLIKADDYISESLTTDIDQLGIRAMIQAEDGRCVCQMSDNRCMIYHERPTTCKRFEPDGEWCKWARKQEGINETG